jgi:prevent-host-death family protein
MLISVSKSALKPKLLSYLRKVERQKVSVTVTDRGRPVAKIIPLQGRKKNPFEGLKGSVLRYDDPLEPVGIEDWELSL